MPPKLDEVKREEARPLPKRVVLTLHGMARTRHSMSRRRQRRLRTQRRRPSTRSATPARTNRSRQAAQSLDRVIRSLDGVEEIDIVAYSMGNLVTRHWLGDVLAENDADGRIVRSLRGSS